MLTERAADDDRRHEPRDIAPGEGGLDLLAPEVSAGNKVCAERFQALLVDLHVVDVTGARPVRLRDERIVVPAVGERDGIACGGGDDAAQPAEVAKVLPD